VGVRKRFGHITKTGKPLSKKEYEYAGPFSGGLAVVKDRDGYHFIDRAGSVAARPPLRVGNLWPIVNGYAEYERDGRRGFIDRKGACITEPVYDAVRPFSEGLAAVDSSREDGNFAVHYWGFINTGGKLVIRHQFADVREFSMGLAPVKIDGKWGYIDKSGKVVVKPAFHEAFPFRRSMGRVCVDYTWGFIDMTGAYVILPRFAGMGEFAEGLARAGMNPAPNIITCTWGYIQRIY